jgi:cullin 1
LDNKDAFIALYGRTLAKRLVRGLPTLDDAERFLLNRLREVYDHTGRLKQMVVDLDTTKDMNSNFEEWLTRYPKAQDVSFAQTFKALSQAHWPLQPSPPSFRASPVLQSACSHFETFFKELYPGRRLLWLWQLCHGEIQMSKRGGVGLPCVIRVSAYQMAILLLFNDSATLSFEELREKAGIEEKVLSVFLNKFVKAKILCFEEAQEKEVYSINDNYAGRMKIDLRGTLKSQKNTEFQEARKKIKEEQSLLLQVSLTPIDITRNMNKRTDQSGQMAIVRIMKARRKATYIELSTEVIAQIQSRFLPASIDIKRCVELLIDREFLENLDNGYFGYLA